MVKMIKFLCHQKIFHTWVASWFWGVKIFLVHYLVEMNYNLDYNPHYIGARECHDYDSYHSDD